VNDEVLPEIRCHDNNCIKTSRDVTLNGQN